MAALPRFDQVAQYVGQYLALHSTYRKGEALSRAVEEGRYYSVASSPCGAEPRRAFCKWRTSGAGC